MSGTSDPIADMLTRVRNALIVQHESVLIPMSKIKFQIARILKEEGYIKSYNADESGKFPVLKINLAYDDEDTPLIKGIKRISKPGLRIYVNKTNIPKVYAGLGTSIITTSHGVITGRDAWRRGLGGEVVCHVW